MVEGLEGIEVEAVGDAPVGEGVGGGGRGRGRMDRRRGRGGGGQGRTQRGDESVGVAVVEVEDVAEAKLVEVLPFVRNITRSYKELRASINVHMNAMQNFKIKYLFGFLVRGLRRLGDEEGAKIVERDYEEWDVHGKWGEVEEGEEEMGVVGV
ncbi:uncharacterized protein A4U43_C07F19050 [Asparagus officinalis]|uniref:Uncharacterized protein n=1 Tax=Asparagus officinalis TaxID=4686 RepID=A0A5P1ED45_ASPOF|nr:uncharacterized protein A4U43_C07F19050 [Asparagus officinalis]